MVLRVRQFVLTHRLNAGAAVPFFFPLSHEKTLNEGFFLPGVYPPFEKGERHD